MIETVLVPMDDSPMAEHALVFALENYPNANVTVLHVAGEPSPFFADAVGLALADNLAEAADEHAETVFERAKAIAAEHSHEIETEVALGHPAKAIVARAGEYDTIVIGSHGRDIRSHILMGDIARKVSRRSPAPVTVVR